MKERAVIALGEEEAAAVGLKISDSAKEGK